MHSVDVGQAMPLMYWEGSTLVGDDHAKAPPAGSIEVSTSPSDPVARHSPLEGQSSWEMYAPRLEGADHVDAPPAGFVLVTVPSMSVGG
jgi:hypothetical protein